MKINSLLLPHPVLGRADDVLGEFSVKEDGFNIQQDDKNTKLSVEFILRNRTLEEFISNKKASFNIEVECPATFFRKSFLFANRNCELEIEKNKLRDKVTVSFYITSNDRVSDYKVEGENEDYQNNSFEIGEGDVLAFAGSINFNAGILWEDLRRIFNIIKIHKDEEREEGSALFLLDGDVILIFLPKKDYLKYDNYKEENDNFTPLYHSSIVLSCLIYALEEMMSEHKDNYKDYKWYRVLDSRRINDKEIASLWNMGNVPEVAQKMLGNPFERMFISIENLSMEKGEE